MVFEELHAADTAVITKQPQRDDEVEHEPRRRELLDRLVLFLAEQRQNQNRANHGQPGDDREKVICEHVSPLIFLRVSVRPSVPLVVKVSLAITHHSETENHSVTESAEKLFTKYGAT